MPSDNVFRKIKDQAERDSIFQHLVTAKREIIVKTLAPDSAVVVLHAQHIVKNRLFCSPQTKPSLAPEGSVILQLTTGDEKYFAQGKIKPEADGTFSMNMDFDLYLLQRREDFRLRIPRSMAARLIAKKWNDQACDAQWTMLDMSAGGCRIQAPPAALKLEAGATLEGILEIQGRSAIPVIAQVKHSAPSPEDPLVQYVGLQFMQLTEISKNRLAALVMDLYREIFSRH